MSEGDDREDKRPALGRVLRVLRSTTDLTQDDWARAAHVRPGTISFYEQGKMAPSLRTLERMMAVLGYRLSTVERAEGFLLELQLPEVRVDRPAETWRLWGPALDREIEIVALERGRLEARWSRLQLLLLAHGRRELIAEEAAPVPGEESTGEGGEVHGMQPQRGGRF